MFGNTIIMVAAALLAAALVFCSLVVSSTVALRAPFLGAFCLVLITLFGFGFWLSWLGI